MRLQDKITIVTGSTSGIGRAIALELAQRGRNCVVVPRSETKLRELAEETDSDVRTSGRGLVVA